MFVYVYKSTVNKSLPKTTNVGLKSIISNSKKIGWSYEKWVTSLKNNFTVYEFEW